MNKKDTEVVLTHLEYIKEKVDANFKHLEKLNGRVGKTESAIQKIMGVGTAITFVIASVLGYFIKE